MRHCNAPDSELKELDLFADVAIESRGLFTCTRATRILAIASIQERRLFRSTYPDNSRAASNREWHLIDTNFHYQYKKLIIS